jgi:AcrR family transcriptional regulator
MSLVGARTENRVLQRRQTESRILHAARRLFSERGFELTTMRAVAAEAKVDPALVIHYYGSKEELFAQAIAMTPEEAPSDDPAETIERLLTSLNVKLGGLSETRLAMMRSMLTHPSAGQAARELLDRQVAAISSSLTTDDAQLRATLAMTTIIGVTIGRELLGVDALQAAAPQHVIDLLRPCLHALLTEEG